MASIFWMLVTWCLWFLPDILSGAINQSGSSCVFVCQGLVRGEELVWPGEKQPGRKGKLGITDQVRGSTALIQLMREEFLNL